MNSAMNRAKFSIASALCLLTVMSSLALAAPARDFGRHDDDGTVRWKKIVGVITAPGIDNPVAGISAGTLPWTTLGGNARVNLMTGAVSFDVDGLVLNGGNAAGTPGPVDQVEGTLVCNPGAQNQALLVTTPVPLSPQGDAEFSGNIGNIPSDCSNPLFLIRIGPDLPGANQRWIAAGAVRTAGGRD